MDYVLASKDSLKINSRDLSETLGDDLIAISRSKKPHLVWKIKEQRPWWQELDYESQGEARKDTQIGSVSHIRDYALFESETAHFKLTYCQGPGKRTVPQGFSEELQLILKPRVWKGHIDETIPTAYLFVDPNSFTQEQRDHLSSPRCTLKRRLSSGWNSSNLEFLSERMFNIEGREIHKIPEADTLLQALILSADLDPSRKDIIFSGEGIEDSEIRANMQKFYTNLVVCYGFAKAGNIDGIHFSSFSYGT